MKRTIQQLILIFVIVLLSYINLHLQKLVEFLVFLFALYYLVIALISKFFLSKQQPAQDPQNPQQSQQPPPQGWSEKIMGLLNTKDENGNKYEIKQYILMNHPVLSVCNGNDTIMPKLYRNFLFYHTMMVGVALAVIYASVLAPQTRSCPPPSSGGIVSDISNSLNIYNGEHGSFQFDTRSTLIVTFLGAFTNFALNQFAQGVKGTRFNPMYLFYHGVVNIIVAVVLRALLGTTFDTPAIYLYIYTFIFSQLFGWFVVSPASLIVQWCIGSVLYKPKDQNTSSLSTL